MKRAMCLVLSLVVLIGMLPVNAFAQKDANGEAVAEATGDVSVTGSNSFGNLLSEELEESTGAGSQNYNGYSVVALHIENSTATVEYSAMEDANLIVGIYTEDGLQLVASGNTRVTADGSVAEVTIEGEMPQYFLASAYLVDVYDYSPLCEAYDTPMYTREMQELLASTVEDYDADKVVQLSDSTETNFAVYNDSVVVIDGDDGINTVATVDYETDTYRIENADAQILNLTAGTVMAYPWAEGELLIIKVASVSVDGTTATITGAELELEEVFDYLKLETEGGMDAAELDASEADEGITYEGKLEDGPSTYAWEGGADIAKSFFFGLEKEFPSQNGTGKVTFSGGLTLSVKGSLSFYISMKRQFVELKLTPEVGISCTVSGALNAQELALGKVKIPTGVPGVVLEGIPKIVLQFAAEVEVAAKISMQVGIGYENGKGFQNLCTKPTAECDVTVSGKVYFGLILKCSAAVIDENIASVGVSNKIGLQLTGTLTGTDFEGEPDEDAEKIHSCERCLDLRYDFVYSLSSELIFLKYIKVEKVYKSVTVHLFNSYFSMDGTSAGFGSCPNVRYRTTLKISKDWGPAGGVSVTEGTQEWGKTNENGILVKYLPEGGYTVTATKEDQSAQKTFTVESAGSVSMDLTAADNFGTLPGIFEQIDADGFNTSRYDVTFNTADKINVAMISDGVCYDNETKIDKFVTNTNQNVANRCYFGSNNILSYNAQKPLFLQQTIQIDALPEYTGGSVIQGNYASANGMAFAITERSGGMRWGRMFLGSIQNMGDGELGLFIANRVTYSTDHIRPVPMLGVKVGEKFVLGVMWYTSGAADIYVNGKLIASYNEATRMIYDNLSIGTYYKFVCTNMAQDAKITVSDIKLFSCNPYGDIQLANESSATFALRKPEQVEDQGNVTRGVFDGEYGSQGTVRTAGFTDLVPGEEYMLLSLASMETEDPLGPSNLLFVDQAAAAEDGTLQFRYIQRQETEFAYVMACGPSNRNLADAQITVPAMWEDPEGVLQAVSPVVIYEGNTLVEGQDYVVVGKADYAKPGSYTCYIRGIYNYTGLVTCTYEVQPWSWTLSGHVTVDSLTVPADVTLDLNGYTLHVDSVASFGDIVDTVGTGCLVAEELVLTENSYLPLFDSEEGGYRFFAYSQKNLGTKTAGENVIFGFALEFENKDAYRLLSDREDCGLDVTMTLGWNDIRMPFAFGSELLTRYAQLQAKYPGLTAALQLTVSGLETLEPGTVLAVTPAVVAVDGQMTEENEAMTYIP